MAIRLNTLLVVLSLPTLLSAAIVLWSRARQSSPELKSPAEDGDNQTDDNVNTITSDNNTSTELSPVVETSAAAAVIAPSSLLVPDSPRHRVLECQEEQICVSESGTVTPASEQQVLPDPAVCLTEGHQTATRTPSPSLDSSDNVTDMRIRDETEVMAANTTPAKASNGTTAAFDPTLDLSSKVEKDLVIKTKNKKPQSAQPASEPASKKNSGKKSDSSPETRTRKTHDSGDSVGAVSVDSDVMSPASCSTEAKSSDRSLDSPCPFKSDVSQGSPCNWGTSDSHSEVRVLSL